MKLTKLSAAICCALTTLPAAANLIVTQDYRTVSLTEGSIPVRPFLLTEDGVAFRKNILSDGAADFQNLVTLKTTATNMEEALDIVLTSPSYSGTEAEASGLRAIFENYPGVPTSLEANIALAELGLASPADPQEFARLSRYFLHFATTNLPVDGIPVSESLIAQLTGEEMVGYSADSYYFDVWNAIDSDSSIYRCDQANFDPSTSVISQAADVCSEIITEVTHAGSENSSNVANYHNLVAVRDKEVGGPVRVILPSGLETSFNSTLSPEFVADLTDDFANSIIINQGERPLILEGLSPFFNLVESTAEFGNSDNPSALDNSMIPLFFDVNSAIHYVHEDGFVEQITYVSEDTYIREMNDKYILVSRVSDVNEDGYPEISREICSYTLTTQYTGGTGIGQGNLGGTITCDNVVATKPANHVIALGYESDVILGAVYPVFYEGLTQSTLYGLPAYAENIITGEKEWLTDAAIELRQREGIGQYYSDAAQMRAEFLGSYEASVTAHRETPAGLMDNYPLPPSDKRAFNFSENISQEEFEAIIAAAEILAVEGNSLYSIAVEEPFKADVDAPIFSEETMALFIADYSRNSFRFLSPTHFMSGAGLYSFSNDTTTTLSGSVTLPGNYVPASGVTVTLLKANGATATTTAAADGTYAFTELTAGDYILSIEYPNHVYECVTATVSTETGSELILPQAELLAGDLSGDGTIDNIDIWRIYVRAFYPGVDYDLNNDGYVSWADTDHVYNNQGASQCQL